jgi:hypothetical protein
MRKSLLVLGMAIAALCSATIPASASDVTVAGCSGAMSVPLLTWQQQKANTGVAGYDGYKQSYEVRLTGGNTYVNVQVKGWNEQNQLTWYGLGAVTPNAPVVRGSVPWGNALATPEVKAYNTGTGAVATIEFSC